MICTLTRWHLLTVTLADGVELAPLANPHSATLITLTPHINRALRGDCQSLLLGLQHSDGDLWVVEGNMVGHLMCSLVTLIPRWAGDRSCPLAIALHAHDTATMVHPLPPMPELFHGTFPADPNRHSDQADGDQSLNAGACLELDDEEVAHQVS